MLMGEYDYFNNFYPKTEDGLLDPGTTSWLVVLELINFENGSLNLL